MSRYLRAEIAKNTPLNKNHNLLVLKPLGASKKPQPGQFYMIRVGDCYDPLLKRPFCIFRNISGKLYFIYRIRGKGTEKLKQMQKGKVVDILGPLGNGYSLSERKNTPLIVIGGVGIASAFSLAEKFSKKAHIFYGGRTKDELLMLTELRKITKNLIISTNDGSVGAKGTVIDTLNKFLTFDSFASGEPARGGRLSALNLILYACGPAPMLEAVSKIARGNGIKGYLSMEENMACGVGACLGCAVKTKNGYKRVCKEGPVFPIEEIVW